jgi:hypothetical protein
MIQMRALPLPIMYLARGFRAPRTRTTSRPISSGGDPRRPEAIIESAMRFIAGR